MKHYRILIVLVLFTYSCQKEIRPFFSEMKEHYVLEKDNSHISKTFTEFGLSENSVNIDGRNYYRIKTNARYEIKFNGYLRLDNKRIFIIPLDSNNKKSPEQLLFDFNQLNPAKVYFQDSLYNYETSNAGKVYDGYIKDTCNIFEFSAFGKYAIPDYLELKEMHINLNKGITIMVFESMEQRIRIRLIPNLVVEEIIMFGK